jgi:two-component system, response regulator
MVMTQQSPILLIEDDPSVAHLMTRSMQAAGISNPVQVAKDVAAAQSILNEVLTNQRPLQECPMLVFLDVFLPGSTGFEFIRWVREQPKLRRIWLVVISPSACSELILRAYEAGANSYLVRPNDLEGTTELMQMVREYWFTLCERPDLTGD